MHDGLTLQLPAAPAERLILLFHGVGARPDSMQPIGGALADAYPAAVVVSVRAPHRSDVGFGWQWFSVRGIDEASRPARVAAAMPEFIATIRHWQHLHQLDAAATTQVAAGLATRIAAIGGRFARPPERAPDQGIIHVLHGEEDPVMPCARGVAACEQLQLLGAQVTLDLFPGLGHEIDGRVIARLQERLQA